MMFFKIVAINTLIGFEKIFCLSDLWVFSAFFLAVWLIVRRWIIYEIIGEIVLKKIWKIAPFWNTAAGLFCTTTTCPDCTVALSPHYIFPRLFACYCSTAQNSSASCWPPLLALQPFTADFLFSSTQGVRRCWLCSNGLLLHGRMPPSGTIAVCNDAPSSVLLSGGAAQPATKPRWQQLSDTMADKEPDT